MYVYFSMLMLSVRVPISMLQVTHMEETSCSVKCSNVFWRVFFRWWLWEVGL